MALLSIIIPVYNVEKYLEKCLSSVICPEAEDYEIIAVNDGSTDSSPEILRRISAEHPGLIRVISTENSGLGSARNTGIAAASGKFLAFIDSDDYFSPGAVEELYRCCLRDDFDIMIYDAASVREDGSLISSVSGCSRDGSFSLEEYPELLFDIPAAWNKLVRRSLFADNEIAFPPRLWFEDLCTMPKLYPHAKKIVHNKKALYNYVQRKGSIMNSAKLARNAEITESVDILTGYYKKLGLFETYHSQLEYTAFYNQLLTASVRVALADAKSEVLPMLRSDFLSRFTDYAENSYIASMPAKYRLISSLVMSGRYGALALVMKANNIAKGKKT